MGYVHVVSHHYKVDRSLKFVCDALESGMKSKQDEEALVEEQCSRISNGKWWHRLNAKIVLLYDYGPLSI